MGRTTIGLGGLVEEQVGESEDGVVVVQSDLVEQSDDGGKGRCTSRSSTDGVEGATNVNTESNS